MNKAAEQTLRNWRASLKQRINTAEDDAYAERMMKMHVNITMKLRAVGAGPEPGTEPKGDVS